MLLARDSGKETLECVPVDACTVLRGAAEQGERLARNRGIDFKIDLPENPERYRFYERWAETLRNPDPYYSPALTSTEKIALNLSDDRWYRPLLGGIGM